MIDSGSKGASEPVVGRPWRPTTASSDRRAGGEVVALDHPDSPVPTLPTHPFETMKE